METKGKSFNAYIVPVVVLPKRTGAHWSDPTNCFIVLWDGFEYRRILGRSAEEPLLEPLGRFDDLGKGCQ